MAEQSATTEQAPEITEGTYVDLSGRTQHSVTGPSGHILITTNKADTKLFPATWEVWRSDSIDTLYRGTLAPALERARWFATH